jgi:uncharacterized membrane protein YdbT with pleckstrin-like domain
MHPDRPSLADCRIPPNLRGAHAMPYVNDVLQPGETVRQVTTVSWVGYLRGLVIWVVAAFILAVSPDQSSPLLQLVGRIAALAVFAIGAYLLVRAWWNRMTIEVAVTDRRVIYKTGFINRHTTEMHMDKIESVDVDQGIFGRLLNFGDITINGTGEGKEHIREIDHPLEFRSHVTAA